MVQAPVKNNIHFNPKEYGQIALVVSQFNLEICQGLLNGAVKLLKECGFPESQYEVFWVPGAFEIPLVTQKLARLARFSGVVALGCVIRGETPHFDFVSLSATYGVLQASLNTETPVTLGIITVENQKQAQDRSRDDDFNKGRESTLALLETVRVLKNL